MKIFMPMSGNLGDTLNVMPVISGLSKNIGEKINLVVRDKMKFFCGFKEFIEMQDCIFELKFESEVNIDESYKIMSLADEFDCDSNRPYETTRFEKYFKERYSFKFDIDDDFVLKVPDCKIFKDKFIIADRTLIGTGDTRRKFDFLRDSKKFPEDKCLFLDYSMPILYNACVIKSSEKTIFTTFTGISVIADLLKKDCVVFWNDELKNWDHKPIQYSFCKHFYRNRKCKLKYFGDFELR